MKTKHLLLILLLAASYNIILADSPLTSTHFSEAYKTEKIVMKASLAKGILTVELLQYLSDEHRPADIKMAVINCLGWGHKGEKNYYLFYDYLLKNKRYENKEDLLDNGKDYELLCLAYLKAMDNYFEVREALQLAKNALSKNPGSCTFNILTALIEAQIMSGTLDWCEVFNITKRVRDDKSLSADMDPKAITIIFEYMDGYKDYCPGGSHAII